MICFLTADVADGADKVSISFASAAICDICGFSI
jgi:hypothetical protein